MFTAWDLLEFVKATNRKVLDLEESNTKILADIKEELKGVGYEVNGKRRWQRW